MSGEYRAAQVPPNMPRLADAIEASERARREVGVSLLLIAGVVAVAMLLDVRRLHRAQLGERAEWARAVDHLDGQVEDAQRRFVVDPDGEATQE